MRVAYLLLHERLSWVVVPFLLHMVLVLLGCSASQSTAMFAQQASTAGPRHDYEVAGSPLSASPVDKQIAAALQEVSAEKIKTNIETLVGFKNRNTTSSTESNLPAGTGVLAAADWLKSQFGSYSQACGGCLEVKEDSFVEQPLAGVAAYRSRIAKPTPIRNVYAVLRGTDPTSRQANVPGHRAL